MKTLSEEEIYKQFKIINEEFQRIEEEIKKNTTITINDGIIFREKLDNILEKSNLLNSQIHSNENKYQKERSLSFEFAFLIIIITIILSVLIPLGVPISCPLGGFSLGLLGFIIAKKKYNYPTLYNLKFINMQNEIIENTYHNGIDEIVKRFRAWEEDLPINPSEVKTEKCIEVANEIYQLYLLTDCLIEMPLDVRITLIKILQEDLQTKEDNLYTLLAMGKQKIEVEMQRETTRPLLKLIVSKMQF